MGKCRNPGRGSARPRPRDDLERKLTCVQWGHHEPPPLIGRVGLVVAPAAERLDPTVGSSAALIDLARIAEDVVVGVSSLRNPAA